MLTLKVISESSLNNKTTHIFPADRISHIEQKNNVRSTFKCADRMDIGELPESECPFAVSFIDLYRPDGKTDRLLIFPRAECYVMQDGKTVDSFQVEFE